MKKENEQKAILTKLLIASQNIDCEPKANYIHLNHEYIAKLAELNNISFDEMVLS